jgi:gliding motility-associated-like protein
VKKLYTLLLIAFSWSFVSAQQQILLMTETFENGTNNFDFNTGGIGTNSGNNQWVVNNNYLGAPLYPDTPPEDSIVSGTINGAPFSHYLHIHDSTSGIQNANWNTSTASDRFTFIGSPFCTLGMTNVIFTFFWIAEGDSNAYGEVYYRINGGAWTKTGLPKYNAQSKWKYEVIQDPAFNNVQNLQLGFRWVNPNSGVPSNVSFGIDDIIAVGTYDPVNNPVTLSVQVLENQICQGSPVDLIFSLSTSLCDASYFIQLSNANGNFGNPTNLGFFTLGPGQTAVFVPTLPTPGNVQGNCFRIRVVRANPDPVIISDTSACFIIVPCPNVIFGTIAPVVTDADTACIESVIDVKFNSTGVFNNNNRYIAELSDSTGNFSDSTFLGQLVTNDSFPPIPKGNIAGLIPASVTPACGYYIRVRSTNPAVLGPPIGPYCLVHCDELTNNHTDLHFCIQSGPYPTCDSLDITAHHWGSQANYDTCNDWQVELRSMKDFSFVNLGGLAVYHDTAGGTFNFCMPANRDSLPPGVEPGTYYMRLTSTCSNLPWNQTGSVVRITIGAPDPVPPHILPPDSSYCRNELVVLTINPFHSNFNGDTSSYMWGSNLFFPDTFVWRYNPLYVTLGSGTLLGDYPFYVHEINNGCDGPSSAAAIVTVIGQPTGVITGPKVVCIHDTAIYNVTYQKDTYFDWSAPPGVTVFDEANSQVTMIFDTVGTFVISNFSLNKCGSRTGFDSIRVVDPYRVDAGPDTTLCEGESIPLTANIAPLEKLFFTTNLTTVTGSQGSMFNIIAHGDVVIDSFAVKFIGNPPSVNEEIWGKNGSYRTFEQNSAAWNQLGVATGFAAKPPSQFTIIPFYVNQPIAGGDTFAFYVTTFNNPAVNMEYSPGVGITQGTVYKTDGIIDFVQGSINTYSFGTFAGPKVLNARIYYTTKMGLHYLWNTGDTLATINFTGHPSGTYSVTVYDTAGCKNTDSLLITIKPSPAVNAGVDTALCPGFPSQLNGTTSEQNFHWQPSTGLSDTAILNPVVIFDTTSSYILSSLGTNGCTGRDTITLTVKPTPLVNAGPDTTLCNGLTYVVPATSSAQNVQWTPAEGLDNASILNPLFNGTHSNTYILIATDATTGCIKTDTLIIGVGANPTLDAGPDADVCTGDMYTMVAVSNGKFFRWNPGAGLSDSTILNPIFNGADSAEYFLVASDSGGCKTIDSVKLAVISCYLKVPQAFSPNGDGNNDHFTVFGSLEQYEIRIFNRWGEMVYNSRDPSELSDLSRGWDGTYKGKVQELGTFAYYIIGKDAGGKSIERKGNLTLVR